MSASASGTSDAPGAPKVRYVPSATSMAAVPAAIALLITLVRLSLEFNDAPDWLASAEAGGLFALVGIFWLPIVFGPYFALQVRGLYTKTLPFVARVAWTLVIYGFLSRIPTALLGVFDIWFGWDTHYGKFPPGSNIDTVGEKIGATLFTQLGIWIVVTVATGLAAGLLATAIVNAFEKRPEGERAAL